MAEETFDFFHLSRELRDLVYEHALVPETWKRFNRGIRTRVEHFPSAALLLVNRQFREEYVAASHRCTSLTIVDVASDMEDLDHAPRDFEAMPRHLQRVHSIDFRLWLAPGLGAGPSGARAEWLAHLRLINNFLCCVQPSQSVSLVLYKYRQVVNAIDECQALLRREQHLWTSIPQLRALTVALARQPDLMTEGPGDAKVVLEWSKQTNELRRVDASNGERTLEKVGAGGLHDDDSESEEEHECVEEEDGSEYVDDSKAGNDGDGDDEVEDGND